MYIYMYNVHLDPYMYMYMYVHIMVHTTNKGRTSTGRQHSHNCPNDGTIHGQLYHVWIVQQYSLTLCMDSACFQCT